MFRILLWRAIFEFLTLLKVVGFHGPDTCYLAYGANLDPTVMKNRGMEIKERRAVSIPDFDLKFNHEVPFDGIGMASIEPAAGKSVPAIAYTLSKTDEWIMDCYEGSTVFQRYRKGQLDLNGKTCYYYYSGRPLAGLRPAATYLQKILNGYRAILAPNSDFLLALEKQETLPKMMPKHPPRFLITNYDTFGKFFRPALEWYDELCTRLYVFFIFRPSIFDRWIARDKGVSK